MAPPCLNHSCAPPRRPSPPVPGFYESVRGFIAHTLVHTYGRVTKRTLADCLKLEGATLEQYVSGAARGAGCSRALSRAGEIEGRGGHEEQEGGEGRVCAQGLARVGGKGPRRPGLRMIQAVGACCTRWVGAACVPAPVAARRLIPHRARMPAGLRPQLAEKCKSAGWSIVNTPAGEVVGLPKK